MLFILIKNTNRHQLRLIVTTGNYNEDFINSNFVAMVTLSEHKVSFINTIGWFLLT